MNLGLLAVASSASQAGHDVDVYDWLGDHQYRLLDELPGVLTRNPPDLVGLSMPSGYGEQYCGPITEQVKRLVPSARIVAGGQYHAGMRPRELLARFPSLDAVATGDGEQLDWEALRRCALAEPPTGVVTRESAVLHGVPPGVSKKELAPEYRFNLLRLDPRSYAPSIEIARGCPFTCSFCSLSGAPTSLERASSKTIQDQLQFWMETWPELERVPIYFECPVFFCNPRNVETYAECLAPFSHRIEWRTQCRVDSVEPDVLPKLHQLGLRMLDLGLESASPRMLNLMNKTEGPTEKYLQRAQSLIDRAAACGVGIKMNILLYAGENEQSAGETQDFIMRNRDKLAGIAAAAAIEFPGSDLSKQLGKLHVQFGTQRREDARVSSAGIYPLDLSREFPLERAREWCLEMTRSVTTAESYYRLKRIGYFRPDFSLSEFMQVVSAADPDSLPFKLTPDENTASKIHGPWDMAQWDQLR
ncbi:hypothetical protein OV208_02150 [Corallococcus sp. bb12-1]|uniref:B12-binding domain-containing radical SAM protein n=1 Tax=Corallococcus sp. bb12-1 TaxID=2996784 RepID=UPI00227156C5|nr:radical SAM protein [Corallococcus sp. bb12-1]MCY1040107.1 hypothetical protein [Corallococcus sp. bb12-1]